MIYFNPLDHVTHPKFGPGVVAGRTQARLKVLFGNGHDLRTVSRDSLTKYTPELPYLAKVRKDERFHFFVAAWNVYSAARIITPNTHIQDFPLDVMQQWFDQHHLDTERREVEENGRKVIKIPMVSVNKEYAMSDAVDLSIPTVMTLIGKSVMLIDGWHRLYKGVKTQTPLRTYVLTTHENELIQF